MRRTRIATYLDLCAALALGFVFVLLCAMPAFAIEPAALVRNDAGVVTHVLTPIDTATASEKRCTACEGERDSLKASVQAAPSPVPLVVAIIAGVVAAAAAFGAGFAAGAASPR